MFKLKEIFNIRFIILNGDQTKRYREASLNRQKKKPLLSFICQLYKAQASLKNIGKKMVQRERKDGRIAVGEKKKLVSEI